MDSLMIITARWIMIGVELASFCSCYHIISGQIIRASQTFRWLKIWGEFILKTQSNIQQSFQNNLKFIEGFKEREVIDGE